MASLQFDFLQGSGTDTGKISKEWATAATTAGVFAVMLCHIVALSWIAAVNTFSDRCRTTCRDALGCKKKQTTRAIMWLPELGLAVLAFIATLVMLSVFMRSNGKQESLETLVTSSFWVQGFFLVAVAGLLVMNLTSRRCDKDQTEDCPETKATAGQKRMQWLPEVSYVVAFGATALFLGLSRARQKDQVVTKDPLGGFV